MLNRLGATTIVRIVSHWRISPPSGPLMSMSQDIPRLCENCGLLSDKLASLQERLAEFDSAHSPPNPFLLSASQQEAVRAALAEMSAEQLQAFAQFARQRRRGAIYALLGRLRELMEGLDLNARSVALALEVSPSVISQWFASGQMGEKYRVRVKGLLRQHGASTELSVDEVRVWEDKYLIAWIHREVLGVNARQQACIGDLELLCLKHAIALNWFPREGSRSAFDRLPHSLRQLLPLVSPTWFSGLLEDYGLPALLLIWKLVYDQRQSD